MKVRRILGLFVLALNVAVAAPRGWPAQDRPRHVVAPEELNRDALKPLETRQADEAAVRHLLSSDAGQEAMASAHVDYQKIDKAIGQLNNEELAKLADRSRQTESDFAAGFISPKHLAELILVIIVVVVIIVLV